MDRRRLLQTLGAAALVPALPKLLRAQDGPAAPTHDPLLAQMVLEIQRTHAAVHAAGTLQRRHARSFFATMRTYVAYHRATNQDQKFSAGLASQSRDALLATDDAQTTRDMKQVLTDRGFEHLDLLDAPQPSLRPEHKAQLVDYLQSGGKYSNLLAISHNFLAGVGEVRLTDGRRETGPRVRRASLLMQDIGADPGSPPLTDPAISADPQPPPPPDFFVTIVGNSPPAGTSCENINVDTAVILAGASWYCTYFGVFDPDGCAAVFALYLFVASLGWFYGC